MRDGTWTEQCHVERATRSTTVRTVTGRLGWATGTVVVGWLMLALVRAWQVGASASQVAPYLYAPLLIAGGGWLGWWAGKHVATHIVSTMLAITGVWMVFGVLLVAEPGKAPIGYPNANAALGIQLLALAALATLRDRTRKLGWLAIAATVLATLANVSRAGIGIALGAGAFFALAVAFPRIKARWPVVLGSITACTTGAVLLVAIARRVHWRIEIDTFVEPTRRYLWNQAWEAFRDRPALGHGPGGYAPLNVLADDPDTMSAHSLPLHVAAELGGVGLLLLLALFACGLTVAARAQTPAAAWITVTAWTALTLHAFLDHLVEFWPIPLAAGLVLGYGLVAKTDAEAEDQVV